jgi:hypothetical protein
VTTALGVRHSALVVGARVDRSGLPVCVDVLGPLALRVHGRPVSMVAAQRRSGDLAGASEGYVVAGKQVGALPPLP